MLALIVYSTAYRGVFYKKNIELDEKIIDETDYSVYITNVPVINLNIEDRKKEYRPKIEIKNFFQKKIHTWV